MNEQHAAQDKTCGAIQIALDDRLDGSLSAERDDNLENHLVACGDCREYQEDLSAMRRGLGALPLLRLPDDALDAVLAATVEHQQRSSMRWRQFALKGLATAAAVALGILLPTMLVSRPSAAVREAEVDEAITQARYVLDFTAHALQRAERTTIDEVIESGVAPVLRRVSAVWTEMPLVKTWRSGT